MRGANFRGARGCARHGFELISGTLEFTVNLAGEPVQKLTLRAVDDPALRAERTIGVRYTVGGALRAYAIREVLVTGATPRAARNIRDRAAR